MVITLVASELPRRFEGLRILIVRVTPKNLWAYGIIIYYVVGIEVCKLRLLVKSAGFYKSFALLEHDGKRLRV